MVELSKHTILAIFDTLEDYQDLHHNNPIVSAMYKNIKNNDERYMVSLIVETILQLGRENDRLRKDVIWYTERFGPRVPIEVDEFIVDGQGEL